MKRILVIGGACQGKTEWVEKNFSGYRNIFIEDLLKENRLGQMHHGVWINKFHLIMKQWLWEGREYKKEVSLFMKNPSWLVASDEIGNGVVPVSKKDRRWREETGRMLCELAKEADEVYRIYCGIATRIKGCDKQCF